jgi:hypothetical protein
MTVRFEPDTNHPHHTALRHRKQITAHWLLSLHVLLDLRQVDPEEEILLGDVARAAITARARDSGTLAEMLTGVHGILDAESRHRASPAQARIDWLGAAYGAVDCIGCAARVGEQPCTGGFGDDPIVKAGALCLEPIFELFRYVVRLVQDVYAPILQGPSERLDLRLIVAVDPGDQVKGSTTFPNDRIEARRAEVRLGLPMGSFDPKHIGEVLYTLMHETFVHAPEGWLKDPRTPSRQTCSLREGFVDRAGVHLLLQRLRTDPPPGLGHLLQPVIRSLEGAHLDRLRPAGPRLEVDERIRTNSVVMDRVRGYDWFERVAGRARGASAARLAACLNACGLSEIDKGRFAVLLDQASQAFERDARAVEDPEGEPRPDRYSLLMGDLLEAAEQNDPIAVLSALNGFLGNDANSRNFIDLDEF